jgi:hypothetical protein
MSRRPPPFPGSKKPASPPGWVGAAIMVVGAAVLVVTILNILPEWRANHVYRETRGVVLGTRLVEDADEDGTTYKPEVHVRYTAGGREHDVWTYDAGGSTFGSRSRAQGQLDRFRDGRECPVWYDPDRPERAVIVRGYSVSTFLCPLVPLGILTVGVILGVCARRGPPVAEPAAPPTAPSPIPDPAVREVPAVALAVGLKPAESIDRSWPMTIALFVVTGIAIPAGLGLFSVGWYGAILLVLGVLTLLGGGWNLLYHVRVGRTAVELSGHPVRPGEPFRVCVRQEGPLRLHGLRVTLRCEESATYQQGTDTRTEKKCIYESTVCHRGEVTAERDVPFEHRAELTLPAGAMHSFASKHNTVEWRLVVQGKPVGLPEIDRSFTFVVVPPAEASAEEEVP